MIAWLIKSILCSGLLWLVYKLFLEREKMHRFNRFYLLGSIIFSLLVPLITIESDAPALPLPENISIVVDEATSIPVAQPLRSPAVVANSSKTPILPFLICLLYGVITTWLLYRFVRNIVSLLSQIRHHPLELYGSAKLVLTKAGIIPHSFLHYIFLDREAFERGNIEKEVLLHELTHVRQRHTLDVLLLEALRIVLWFNPFLYLYRKAIQLNHEFLADASVVNTFDNTPAYQYLLLGKAGASASLPLSHAFNYSVTKKRLLMMTRKNHRLLSFFKRAILVPALAATAVLIFSERVLAQTQRLSDAIPSVNQPGQKDTTRPHVWAGKPIGSTKEGVSQELLSEYGHIIDNYKLQGKRPLSGFQQRITREDRNRLETIFKQMSREQQQKQQVAFILPPGPLPKVTPTQKQLEAFKNTGVYGVWINGKKVSNATLNNYTNADFSQVFISKLYGAAKKNVSYTHQVDLMTNSYYQDYYNKAIAQKESIMILTWQGPPETKSEEVR